MEILFLTNFTLHHVLTKFWQNKYDSALSDLSRETAIYWLLQCTFWFQSSNYYPCTSFGKQWQKLMKSPFTCVLNSRPDFPQKWLRFRQTRLCTDSLFTSSLKGKSCSGLPFLFYFYDEVRRPLVTVVIEIDVKSIEEYFRNIERVSMKWIQLFEVRGHDDSKSLSCGFVIFELLSILLPCSKISWNA